jgi:hypothetical protein
LLRKTFVISGALLLSAGMTRGNDAGYSIGLKFGSNEANSTLAPTDKAGLPAIAQVNWNMMPGQSGSNATAVQSDNKGTAADTALFVGWASNGTWASSGRGEENNGFVTGPDRVLMTGYLDTGNATTTTLDLLGIPNELLAKGYDVYVYALGGVPGRGGAYRILNLDTATVARGYKAGDSSTNPSTYIEDPGFTHTDTGDYLVFRSLTAANIRIEATTENGQGFGGTPRAPLNAVQLVPSAGLLTLAGIQALPSSFAVTVLDSATTQLDTNNIAIKLNGTAVSSSNVSTVRTASDTSLVVYSNPGTPFAAGSTNTVEVTVKDNTGAPVTATLTFVVGAYATVPANFNAGTADTSKPGFKVRTVQLPAAIPLNNSTADSELLLSGQILDPNTGLTATNTANLSGAVNGYFSETNVINYNINAVVTLFNADNGHPDAFFPGIPGSEGNSLNFVTEAQAYLALKAGSYQMGVNSDDGFKLSVGPDIGDVLGVTLGEFSGGRGVSESLFSFYVPADGVYPFRLVYEQGGGDASLEWYVMINGQRVLINDLSATSTVKAYQAVTTPTRPFIKSVTPVNTQAGVKLTNVISFTLQNGRVSVNNGSIALKVNGTNVTPVVTASVNGAVVTYAPLGGLKNSTVYNLQLTYSDNGTPVLTRTANLSFVTERVAITLPPLQEIGGLVVWEAENFDTNIVRGGHQWTFGSSITNYSGEGYMQALPDSDSGTPNDPLTIPTTAAEIDYKINFQTPGVYYIWLRGYAPSGSSDSVHSGLDFGADSALLEQSIRITGFATAFSWQRGRQTPSTGNPYVMVDTAGDHVFNIWMREDGMIVDKILLTTDANYVPAGAGPAENLRVGQIPPVISISSPTNNATFAAGANVSFNVNATISAGTITNVEYFANGVKIGQTNSTTAAFTFNSAPTGRYVITAKATSAAGISTTSSPIAIVVGNPPEDVLFVNATGGPNAADLAVMAHLRNDLGMNVTNIADNLSATSDALGKTLIVISSSVSSGNVGDKFRLVSVPVLNWENALEDNFLLTADAGGHGSTTGQTNIQILDASQSMAAGLSGVVTIADTPAEFSWGVPVAGSINIAALTDGSGNVTIYGVDKGTLLIDGVTTNAARRVHFLIGDATYTALNASGKALFDAAVGWALNKTLGLPQPKLSVVLAAGGQVNITWTNGGTLYAAPSVTGPWTTTGNTSGSFSASASGSMQFYQVKR